MSSASQTPGHSHHSETLAVPGLVHKLLEGLGNVLQHLVLLAFRLSWGWQFFLTGKGKLLNHGDVADFFASLHLPVPGLNAWFIGGLECFGGLLLLVGLFSRPVAFLLTIAMSVAYLAVASDRAKVFSIFHDPTPFLTADPFFFLLTAILVLAFGPGSISVDWLISKWQEKQGKQSTSNASSTADKPTASVR